MQLLSNIFTESGEVIAQQMITIKLLHPFGQRWIMGGVKDKDIISTTIWKKKNQTFNTCWAFRLS